MRIIRSPYKLAPVVGGGGGGGGGAVWRGNEPAGTTFISTQTFSSMPSGGWTYFSNASTVSDPTAPRSPNSVMKCTVDQQSNSVGFVEKAVSGFRTIYACTYIKLDAGWKGHVTSTNKLGFMYVPSGGVSENKFFWRAAGVGAGSLQVGIALQAVVSGGNFDGGVTGLYDSNLSPSTEFRRGQWDLLEIIATANTVGNADGGIDMYLNGVHCTSCSGIKFTNDANPNWYIFQPNCLWGGGGDSTSFPPMFDLEYDEFYLSGKN
jgi:hypothetical protein